MNNLVLMRKPPSGLAFSCRTLTVSFSAKGRVIADAVRSLRSAWMSMVAAAHIINLPVPGKHTNQSNPAVRERKTFKKNQWKNKALTPFKTITWKTNHALPRRIASRRFQRKETCNITPLAKRVSTAHMVECTLDSSVITVKIYMIAGTSM